MVPVSGVPSSTASPAELALIQQLYSLPPAYLQQQLQQGHLAQQQLLMQLQQSGGLNHERFLQELFKQVNLGQNGAEQIEQLRRQQAAERERSQAVAVAAATTSATGSAAPVSAALTVDTSQPSSSVPKASPAVQTPQEDHTVETQQLAAQKSAISEELEAKEKTIRRMDAQDEHLIKKKERLKIMANESDDHDEEVKDVKGGEETQAVPQVQQIIMENAKRKMDLENSFPPHLRIPEDSRPLYIEPSDAPGIRELAARHAVFAPKLRAIVRQRMLREKQAQLAYEMERQRLWKEWSEKDQELERSEEYQKKMRQWNEDFEATFKELGKQRGEKERLNRMESRNGVEFLAVHAEETDLEKKMRNAAIIPPMMYCQLGRRTDIQFVNKNHIHTNVAQREKKRMEEFEATWSEQDLAMFKNRLKIVGKNFANIAKFFPEKNVKDCVQCYYLLIKKYNKEYKSMLPRLKKRLKSAKYRPPAMPTTQELAKYHQNAADLENSSGAPLVPDVRCSKCQQKCDPSTNTVRVTRALTDSFGKSEKKGADVNICGKCFEAEQKLRSGRCLVKACFDSAKKLKPTKALPAKWKQMDERQKAFLHHDIGLPRDVNKTCHNCNKKIIKRLEELLTGALDREVNDFESNLTWDDDEVARLLALTEEQGTDDWDSIAEQMDGRGADECRQQWLRMQKSSPDSEEEEDEAEDTETKDFNADEATLLADEETQDVPEDEAATTRDRESAPVIDLSPEPMDTTAGPSVIQQQPPADLLLPTATAPAALATQQPVLLSGEPVAPIIGAKIGSITAGTPLRPSSVTILDSTPAAPATAGPSSGGGLPPSHATPLQQQPPGTAPPQSSSARGTPQIMMSEAEKAIRMVTQNSDEQKKLMQMFQSGVLNVALNQANPYAELLRQQGQQQGMQSQIPAALENEYHRKLEEQKRQQQQQQHNQQIQQMLAAQQQQLVQATLSGQGDLNMMIQNMLAQTQLQQQQQHLQQQQRQQQQQAAQQGEADLVGRFDKAYNELDLVIQHSKQEHVKLSVLQHSLSGTTDIGQLQNYLIQQAHLLNKYVQEPYQAFQLSRSTLEQYCKQYEEELKKMVQQEQAVTRQQTETRTELNQTNQTLQTMVVQLQALIQAPHAVIMGMNALQYSTALQAPLQQASSAKELLEQKLRTTEANLQAIRQRKEPLSKQIERIRDRLQKTSHIPRTCADLSKVIAEHASKEILQRQRHAAYPPTTMAAASLQQQQQMFQQALLQQIQQQQAVQAAASLVQQAQQAAQAQQVAAAQKMAQPVRKDNTWVAELEKQSSAARTQQMGQAQGQQQQQRQQLLNTIGKKVIGEELAAQQSMISPGQQMQMGGQQQGQAQAQNEPIKRKSGLETVVIDHVPSNVRHQMQAPHMRRTASPLTTTVVQPPQHHHHHLQQQQQQMPPQSQTLANKAPTSRSITGIAPLAVQTSMAVGQGHFASPVQQQHLQLLHHHHHHPQQQQQLRDFDFAAALRQPSKSDAQQNLVTTGLPKEPEVHRKQGIAYAKPEGGKTADSLTNFPFVCSPSTLDRPASIPRNHEMSALGVNQQQQMLVSPGLKISPRGPAMTRDTIPTTSVADVAHAHLPHISKPGTTNGLLGEIEPMSPDSPKNAAISPATLGGEAQTPLSTEPRVYSMMDDVFFEDDGPIFRPISPKSCLYPGNFVDSPFEDISDEEPAVIHMDS